MYFMLTGGDFICLFTDIIFSLVLQASNEQKITRLTACLTGRGPKLRIDCRYQNVTNNPLKYEFKLKRNKEPEIIISTIHLNFFTDKYHNRATIYTARGLVQLHIERFNASDVGLYYCTLNIPNDITVNQTAKISVQKGEMMNSIRVLQLHEIVKNICIKMQSFHRSCLDL